MFSKAGRNTNDWYLLAACFWNRALLKKWCRFSSDEFGVLATRCTDLSQNVHMNLYIYIFEYPRSYIQYGHIPTGIPPHPTPPHPMPGWSVEGPGVGGHAVGWGVGGWIPCMYIPILNIRYLTFSDIYIYTGSICIFIGRARLVDMRTWFKLGCIYHSSSWYCDA